jgi:hypothetical protein
MSGNLHDCAIRLAPIGGAFVRERLLCSVPMEPGNGARAVLIGIGRAVGGEEREIGVGARVDADPLNCLRLMSAFNRSFQGNNLAGTHE